MRRMDENVRGRDGLTVAERDKLQAAGAAIRERTAPEQGLPVAITDPATLDRLAAMFLAGGTAEREST